MSAFAYSCLFSWPLISLQICHHLPCLLWFLLFRIIIEFFLTHSVTRTNSTANLIEPNRPIWSICRNYKWTNAIHSCFICLHNMSESTHSLMFLVTLYAWAIVCMCVFVCLFVCLCLWIFWSQIVTFQNQNNTVKSLYFSIKWKRLLYVSLFYFICRNEPKTWAKLFEFFYINHFSCRFLFNSQFYRLTHDNCSLISDCSIERIGKKEEEKNTYTQINIQNNYSVDTSNLWQLAAHNVNSNPCESQRWR